MRLKICIALMVGYMSSGCAQAQSAEETALFLSYGIEEGGAFTAMPAKSNWQKDKDNPGTYFLKFADKDKEGKFYAVAKKIKDCAYGVETYAIITDKREQFTRELGFDFREIVSIKISDASDPKVSKITLNGSKGSCVIIPTEITNINCMDKVDILHFSKHSESRLNNALDYMKKNYCNKKAY